MNEFDMKPFIGIMGLLGSGKTTLTVLLADALQVQPFNEPVDENPLLALFYNDMRTHSFHLQIRLLAQRLSQHQQIIWRQRGGVQDRTIYEDSIFCEILRKSGRMTELEFETYHQLFRLISFQLKQPDILIFLDVAPEIALERIRKRGRKMEEGVTLDYLRALQAEYETFIERHSQHMFIVRVDWNRTMANNDKWPTRVVEVRNAIEQSMLERRRVTKIPFNQLPIAEVPAPSSSIEEKVKEEK